MVDDRSREPAFDSMSTTKEIVSAYFERARARDYAGLRALLDDDLRFEGPIETFVGPEMLVVTLRRFAKITASVALRRVFVDGDDACVIYDVVTNTPIGESPMAEWLQTRGGKIVHIRVYFDSQPFAALFGTCSSRGR